MEGAVSTVLENRFERDPKARVVSIKHHDRMRLVCKSKCHPFAHRRARIFASSQAFR